MSDSILTKMGLMVVTSILFFTSWIVKSQAQADDVVRLVSSHHQRTLNLSAGRLEVLLIDKWGSVCSRGFDVDDASVACKQLGFIGALAYTTAAALSYPRTKGSIWLSDLDCPPSSSNSDLRVCPGQSGCTADDVVILSCFREGSIRLVDTEADPFTEIVKAGRLEIYLRGEWGTVCRQNEFALQEAMVACRQLGFSSASSYGDVETISGRIWLEGFDCLNLSSPTLLSCSHSEIDDHSCSHQQDVVLECLVLEDPPPITSPISVITTPSNHSPDQSRNAISAAIVTGIGILLFIAATTVFSLILRSKKAANENREESGAVSTSCICTPCSSGGSNSYQSSQSGGLTHAEAPIVPQTSSSNSGTLWQASEQALLPDSTLQEAPPPSYTQATMYPLVHSTDPPGSCLFTASTANPSLAEH